MKKKKRKRKSRQFDINLLGYKKAKEGLMKEGPLLKTTTPYPKVANVVTTYKLFKETETKKRNRENRRLKQTRSYRGTDTIKDHTLDLVSIVRQIPAGKLDLSNFAALVCRMVDQTTALIFKSGNVVTVRSLSPSQGIWTCHAYAHLLNKMKQLYMPENTDFSDWYPGCGYLPATPIMTTLEGQLRFKECFPDTDHQLLTNEGFMFLDEVLERVKVNRGGKVDDWDGLRFASYDESRQQLIYEEPIELVINSVWDHPMVETTHKFEASRWGDGSNPFGMDKRKGNSTGISLVTTVGHNIYIATGKLTTKGQLLSTFQSGHKATFSRFKASKLLIDEISVLRNLAIARGGVFVPEATFNPSKKVRNRLVHSVKRKHKIQLMDNNAPIHVQIGPPYDGPIVTIPGAIALNFDATKTTAFLELFGFWLGDGSMSSYYVLFSQVKSNDLVFIKDRLVAMKIPYTEGVGAKETTIRIKKESFHGVFHKEFGKKYAFGGKTRMANIKSAKWLPDWVFQLTRAGALSIIHGYRMADGRGANVYRADGDMTAAQKELFTSSVTFRDQLIRLCLHAGQTAIFSAHYLAGESRGNPKNSLRTVVSKHVSWLIRYSDSMNSEPVLRAKTVKDASLGRSKDVIRKTTHTGRTWCVSMPSGLVIVRRAHAIPQISYNAAIKAMREKNKDATTRHLAVKMENRVPGEPLVVLKASRPVVSGNCWRENIVGHGYLGCNIDLAEMSIQNPHVTRYEPASFPGLQWKASVQDKKTGERKIIKNLIFSSGMWLIIGALHMRTVNEVFFRLRDVAARFQDMKPEVPKTKRNKYRLDLLWNKRFQPILNPGDEEADVPYAFRTKNDKNTVPVRSLSEQIQNLNERINSEDKKKKKADAIRRTKKRGPRSKKLAERNDPKAMQDLTNQENVKGYSLLMKAVERGQYANVEFLLGSGQNVSFMTEDGTSALDLLDGKEGDVYQQIRVLLLQHLIPKEYHDEAIGLKNIK